MLALNMVDTSFPTDCLLVSLLRNFSCISKDSILALDMFVLVRMAHHSKTIYIHFEYIDYFFGIVFSYCQACFKILEIAGPVHMMIIC